MYRFGLVTDFLEITQKEEIFGKLVKLNTQVGKYIQNSMIGDKKKYIYIFSLKL